jgi:hypothetical protein
MGLNQENLREAMRRGDARFEEAMMGIKDRYTFNDDQKALLQLLQSLPEEYQKSAMAIPEVAKVMKNLEV